MKKYSPRYFENDEAYRTQDKVSIDEMSYLPNNLSEIINHDRYHCSLKGCDIETQCIKICHYKNGYILVRKICHTHGIVCSKTGWELGYYLGTDSRSLMKELDKTNYNLKNKVEILKSSSDTCG